MSTSIVVTGFHQKFYELFSLCRLCSGLSVLGKRGRPRHGSKVTVCHYDPDAIFPGEQ